MIEPFLTSDPKLDALTTHAISLKTELGLKQIGFRGPLANARGGVLVEYIAQSTTFGDAIIGQLAFTVPFQY